MLRPDPCTDSHLRQPEYLLQMRSSNTDVLPPNRPLYASVLRYRLDMPEFPVFEKRNSERLQISRARVVARASRAQTPGVRQESCDAKYLGPDIAQLECVIVKCRSQMSAIQQSAVTISVRKFQPP